MTDVIRIKRRLSGGAGAPATLANAELAFNEVDNTLYYGKGNNAGQATSIIPIAGAGVGGTTVTISDTAPSSPTVGALWFDSVQGDMYIRFADADSTQWVPVTSPPPSNAGSLYLPLSGGVLTGPLSTSGAIPASVFASSLFTGPVSLSHIVWNLYLNAGNTAWMRGSGTLSGGLIEYGNNNFVWYTTPVGTINTAATLIPLMSLSSAGTLTINGNATDAVLTLNAAAPLSANIYGVRGIYTRWLLQLANATAESGSNVGSDFGIHRYADNGAYLGQVLGINRATGVTYFLGAVSVAAKIAAANFVIADETAPQAGTVGFTTGNGPGIVLYGNSHAGAGAIQFYTGGASRGQITSAGRWSLFSVEMASAGTYSNAMYWQTNYAADAFYIQGYHNPGVEASFRLYNSGYAVGIDNGGNWKVYTGSGYKPGGGVWLDVSDIRTKENVQDYTRGLSAIVRLNPVTYQKNGFGGTFRDGKTYIGLVANDVRDIMPEMIGIEPTSANLPEEEQLLTVDATAAIYALINAVKELKAEIDALKATLQ